jgi:glutamate--cysteine ligase
MCYTARLPERNRGLESHAGTDAPIRSIDDLLAPFHDACKPRSAFRVGTEAEKHGVLLDSGLPIPWSGERSVQTVLSRLCTRHGWAGEREHEAGEVIALRRGDVSITLEPAGQLELSGAPLPSIHDTAQEFRKHLAELADVCQDLGMAWLSVGFQPFAALTDLPRVPKLRYGIMERYLPTRGPRGLDMMRRTCTVQANLDYESETDAMRKLRVGLALQPIATALFAHSPFREGKPSGLVSERADVWLHMDPDRSGILPFAWERDLSFRAYVEWALDVPMFLIKRGARVLENTHQTFRTFMRDGSGGEQATVTDWRTHLNTLFPEARLKNILEMRGADAQPGEGNFALPALWKGVMDDELALRAAETLVEPLTARAVDQARPNIARDGLRAELAGRPLRAWAADLVEVAASGLQRAAQKNADGHDESIYLTPLRTSIERGVTPADELLARTRGANDLRTAIIAATRVA